MATDTQTPASTPPWGDDFDAARAWTLLQNVRADLATAKDSITTERQARTVAEDALKTADPEGKLAAAEKRAVDTEKSLFVERAIRKFPDLETLADLLTGDTEEEILAKAERLAKLGKPAEGKPDADADAAKAAADAAAADADKDGLPGRPAPSLTPGHGAPAPVPFDADAIVSKVRGGVR